MPARALTPHPPRWDPIKTTKTSFLGTLNMLGLAKRCRARMLITSTSEVYGDPLQHPQTETYWGNVNCIGERSCYDEGEERGGPCACTQEQGEQGRGGGGELRGCRDALGTQGCQAGRATPCVRVRARACVCACSLPRATAPARAAPAGL
jgi:hypothetical protein